MRTPDIGYILQMANERDEVNSFLNKPLQEERILARLSELQFAKDLMNSDYYWSRVNHLCDEFMKLRTSP